MLPLVCSWLVVVFLTPSFSEEVQEIQATKGLGSAIVPSKQVPAIIGYPLNISCFSSGQNALQLCRWERVPSPNGKRYIVTLKDTDIQNGTNRSGEYQDDSNCNCSYSYIGNGLDAGDCTISMNNITEFHIAKWECTLVGRDDRTWFGNLKITRLADKPYFKNTSLQNGSCFETNSSEKTDVTCCMDMDSDNPITPVTINIHLATNESIAYRYTDRSKLGFDQSNNSLLRGDQVCQRSQYTFRPEDNGKHLVCIATFMHQLQKHNQTTFLPVNVKYGPILHTGKVAQQITDHNSLLINITFMANPLPDSSWYLKYDPASGASFEIRKNHVKYKVNLQHLRGDNYSATLEVLNLQPEDYRREFLLKLCSTCGNLDIPILLSRPVAGNHTNPETYWIPILMGIAIMIALILLATVIFIFIRRQVKGQGKYVPTQVKYSIGDENLMIK